MTNTNRKAQVILAEQSLLAEVVLTASQLSANEKAIEVLKHVQDLNEDDVLGELDEVLEHQACASQQVVDSTAQFQVLLAEVGAATDACTIDLRIMRDCVAVSEATALAVDRHNTNRAVILATQEANMQDAEEDRTVAEDRIRKEGENHERLHQERIAARDRKAAIDLDAFNYDHKVAVGKVERNLVTETKQQEQDISAAVAAQRVNLDERHADLSAKKGEVEAAESVIASADDDTEKAVTGARSAAIKEVLAEGVAAAALATVLWEGEIAGLQQDREMLTASMHAASRREAALEIDLSAAEAELRTLHTAAVGGQQHV